MDTFFMMQEVQDAEVAIDKAIEARTAVLDTCWEAWIRGLSERYPNHLFWFLDAMGSVMLSIIRVKPKMRKPERWQEVVLPGVYGGDERVKAMFAKEIDVLNDYIDVSDRFKFALSEVQAYRGKVLPWLQLPGYRNPILWNWSQDIRLWLDQIEEQ